MYNWQMPNWPDFIYDEDALRPLVSDYLKSLGTLEAYLEQLPEEDRERSTIHFLVCEALKTAKIEGESLSEEDIYSSVRHGLGLSPPPKNIHDIRAKCLSDMLIAQRNSFDQPITEEMLGQWHHILLEYAQPTTQIGEYRTFEEKMRIISGRIGKQTVHFEAPPSKEVPRHMQTFMEWFNKTTPAQSKSTICPIIRAGISHIYFESIHPYEDGNGRIGRAIVEKALSQAIGAPIFYSISTSIEKHRKSYYKALNQASCTLDLTKWLIYFLNMLIDAQTMSKEHITYIVKKQRFWQQYANNFNQRQSKVINRMLSEGPDGFEGGMHAKKYMAITRCSKATATRDLSELLQIGVLAKLEGSGRSTRYQIIIDGATPI